MLPTGIIAMWSGAIGNIPAGWTLCDGTNDTPDLRDRFVVGAGTTYAVDDSGGDVWHKHTFNTDGHIHSISSGAAIGAGVNYADDTDSALDQGLTADGSSLPPYYALAYIMKT